MYTIPEIRRLLGLSTDNQVRNRIDAIRDLLAADIRRGPNNQILITERGLGLLRSLHQLCETGHTLKEASNILRFREEQNAEIPSRPPHETEQNRADPGCRELSALVEHLAREVEALDRRLTALEGQLRGQGRPWWLDWIGAQ